MYVLARINREPARLWALFGMVLVGGCGAITGQGDDVGSRSTLNLSVLGADSETSISANMPILPH